MEKKNITLVFGAGLGINYGFPSNSCLKCEILRMLDATQREPDKELLGIIDKLADNNKLTVDSIAGEIKKIKESTVNTNWKQDHFNRLQDVVAKAIITKENKNLLYRAEGNHYRTIIKYLDLRKSEAELNVITFNYDRSFQQLLHEFNFWKDDEEKLKVNIKNVYGRMPPLRFEGENINGIPDILLDYGLANEKLVRDKVEKILVEESLVKFICDILTKNNLEDIKKIIKESGEIYFSGFGYHEENLKILGFPLDNSSKRIIRGDAYKLGERKRINVEIKFPIQLEEDNISSDIFFKKLLNELARNK